MGKLYKAELSGVICEECSSLSGKISKVDFEKYRSVLKPPMNIRIFLQISKYDFERYKYCKNKTKFLFQKNIPFLFKINMLEWFIL